MKIKIERMDDSMKKFIRHIEEHVNLYRDDKNGIAWIEDGRTGLVIGVHSNINVSGSVRGMKDRGYWGKNDRMVKSHGWIYNIDTFICNGNNELERIVADECCCNACLDKIKQEKIEKQLK